MSIRASHWSWFAIGLGLLYTLITTSITWAEHATYNRTSLDLGVYTQLVWNMAHGRPFETTLLLLQQVALALSGLPLFWLARCRLGPRLGLMVLACYYAMPLLTDIALDGMYPIVFAAVPAGLAAALAL